MICFVISFLYVQTSPLKVKEVYNDNAKYSDLFEEDIYDKIDLINCLKSRNVPGGPAPEAVKNQINIIKKQFIKWTF